LALFELLDCVGWDSQQLIADAKGAELSATDEIANVLLGALPRRAASTVRSGPRAFSWTVRTVPFDVVLTIRFPSYAPSPEIEVGRQIALAAVIRDRHFNLYKPPPALLSDRSQMLVGCVSDSIGRRLHVVRKLSKHLGRPTNPRHEMVRARLAQFRQLLGYFFLRKGCHRPRGACVN
jgi:hypothetical protein